MEPNKYYLFHCEIGHLTSKCYDLKDEIEDLIRRGCLQEYRHDRRWESDHREKRQEERPRQEETTTDVKGMTETEN